MKKTFIFLTIICYSMFFISCSNSKFVAKKYNEFVTNFKKDGTRIIGGEYSKFKKPKNNFDMNKEILKLHKLIPNKNYDSLLYLFEIDFEYLAKMNNFIKNSKYRKDLLPLSETEYNDLKWDFDSIRMANPSLPIQILH